MEEATKVAAICLMDLEKYLLSSSFDEDWANKKSGFLSAAERINDESDIHVLFEQLKLLESHVKLSLRTEEWVNSERSNWRYMTDPDNEKIACLNHFIYVLKFMEENVLQEAFCDEWHVSARGEWLGKGNPLVAHFPQNSVSDDLVRQHENAPLLHQSSSALAHDTTDDSGYSFTPAGNETEQAIQCLKELEKNIPSSSLNEDWKIKKDEFISSIDQVTSPANLKVLYEQLKSLASHVKCLPQADASRKWEEKYWKIITDPDLDVSYNVPGFVIIMKFVEEFLLTDKLGDEWKLARRKRWIQACNTLIDPLFQFNFYQELLIQFNAILELFGYENFSAYDSKLSEVIAFIESTAGETDKVNTGTGIADTVAGGLGITAGILGGVGLILAPFTAGVSTVLTLTSLGIGVGSASTSITSVVVKNVLDKKKLAEVQREMEKITGETLALIKLFENHSKAVEELNEKLMSLGKDGALKYLENAASASLDLINGGRNIASIIVVAKQIITQGVNSSVAIESAVPSVLRGATSLTTASFVFGGILSVVAIGFGIFGTILGAKKIKDGSQLAKSLYELASSLKGARTTVHECYGSVRNFSEACETTHKTDDTNISTKD